MDRSLDLAATPPVARTSAQAPAETVERRPAWLYYGDAMRCISAVAVVLHHVAMQGMPHQGGAARMVWVAHTVAVRSTLWAVPVFFMLSGALLLDPARKESLAAFYRRRFTRVGIPFVFWSLFYLGCALAAHRRVGLHAAISEVARGHLWFIYILAAMYVLTPWLRRVVQRLGPAAGEIAALLLLAVAAAWVAYASRTGSRWPVVVSIGRYAAYYLSGFYLRAASQRAALRVVAGAATLAILCHVSVFTASPTTGEVSRQLAFWMSDNLSPYMVVLSLSVFILLREVFASPARLDPRAARFVHVASSATLGIYLVHPLVQAALAALWPATAGGLRWAGMAGVTMLVFAASLLLTVAIGKAPVLRAVVGYPLHPA